MGKVILDGKILLKIAQKEGVKDLLQIRKRVDAFARRRGVPSQVALVLMAKKLKIGTANYFNSLNENLQRIILSNSSVSNPSPSERIMHNTKSQSRTKKRVPDWINYETGDHFKQGHIIEINKAYACGCYTAVFILARKIVENLIIDILRKKYPENLKVNKEIYFDLVNKRLRDFKLILEELNNRKDEFGTRNKAVERLCSLSKKLKDDANNKTHSWYHLVKNRQEIDNLDFIAIMEIIKDIEVSVGIR